jgi:phage shock protein C
MTASSDFNHGSGFSEGPSRPVAPSLYRSRTNRVFAGVCGGIAEHFNAEPSAVRLLTVLIAVLTGLIPVVLLYLVAAIFLPVRLDGEAEGSSQAGVALAPGQGGLLIGLLLVALGFLTLANQMLRVDWDLLWPVGVVALGVALVVAAQRR